MVLRLLLALRSKLFLAGSRDSRVQPLGFLVGFGGFPAMPGSNRKVPNWDKFILQCLILKGIGKEAGPLKCAPKSRMGALPTAHRIPGGIWSCAHKRELCSPGKGRTALPPSLRNLGCPRGWNHDPYFL